MFFNGPEVRKFKLNSEKNARIVVAVVVIVFVFSWKKFLKLFYEIIWFPIVLFVLNKDNDPGDFMQYI